MRWDDGHFYILNIFYILYGDIKTSIACQFCQAQLQPATELCLSSLYLYNPPEFTLKPKWVLAPLLRMLKDVARPTFKMGKITPNIA